MTGRGGGPTPTWARVPGVHANESNGKKKSRCMKTGGIRRTWRRQEESELHTNNRGWSKRGLDFCRG